MALGLAIFFLVACLGILWLMRLWLRRQEAGPRVQGFFSLAVLFGALLGIWLSFRAEITVTQDLRFIGAPLPLAVFRHEDGQWVDYPHPRPIMAVLIMANSALISATLAGPLVLWFSLRARIKNNAS